MNYAIIDLGSNTIRLCVYEYADGMLRTIINQKETAALAGYVSKGVLQQQGIDKASEVLNTFGAIANRLIDTEKVHVIATASLRNITNSDEALAIIKRNTGMDIRILSGEEEAHFDFMGASHQTARENGLLIHIGGASTEFVFFANHAPMTLTSIPIGCLNLYSQFVEGFFPTAQERRKIKKEINHHLDTVKPQERSYEIMIGVGGTLKAANKLTQELRHLPATSQDMTGDDIIELNERSKKRDSALFQMVCRAIPERVLTIVPGLMLLRQIIKRFECKTIHISEYGVREGYLLDRVINAK